MFYSRRSFSFIHANILHKVVQRQATTYYGTYVVVYASHLCASKPHVVGSIEDDDRCVEQACVDTS